MGSPQLATRALAEGTATMNALDLAERLEIAGHDARHRRRLGFGDPAAHGAVVDASRMRSRCSRKCCGVRRFRADELRAAALRSGWPTSRRLRAEPRGLADVFFSRLLYDVHVPLRATGRRRRAQHSHASRATMWCDPRRVLPCPDATALHDRGRLSRPTKRLRMRHAASRRLERQCAARDGTRASRRYSRSPSAPGGQGRRTAVGAARRSCRRAARCTTTTSRSW